MIAWVPRVADVARRVGLARLYSQPDVLLETEVSELIDELVAEQPIGWRELLFRLANEGSALRMVRLSAS